MRSSPGPGPRSLGAPKRLAQHSVELTHVAEPERAQERPERRGRRHAVVEQRGGTPGAQGVAIVDRVAVERHRRDQRHDLRVRVRRPRTIAQANRLVNQRLDPERSGDRRRQHDPRLRDKPLVVAADRQSTRRDNQPPIVDHVGDPRRGAAAAHFTRYEARLRSSFQPRHRTDRRIEAKRTYSDQDLVDELEEIVRNGKSAAARIAAIKMLKEWEKDDKPKEGWKDLDAAKPTLKAVS